MLALAADNYDSAVDKNSADVDFFPSEDERMDEEGMGMDESRNRNKMNSSQKRQMQRDNRRARNNPNRSQRDEEGERRRKYGQSQRRGRREVDPSDPDYGSRNFPRQRENERNRRCNGGGRSCRFHRVNNDPNPRRRNADWDCLDRCNGSNRCKRRCLALDDVEDVEYIADFLHYEDVEFIADFLKDLVFDDDDDDEVFEDGTF